MARKSAKSANGRRYAMAEKAIAVQIVRAAGGNVTDEALGNIRTILGTQTLDTKTLVSWMKRQDEINYPKPKPSASSVEVPQVPTGVPSLDFQQEAAYAIVEHTFRNYAKRANVEAAVEDTDGPAAAKVMADMAKLMQLLQGLPTEIVELAGRFVEKAKQNNDDPRKIMEALINDYDSASTLTDKD